MRERQVIQAAAISAAKEHSLSLDHVEHLMSSTSREDFMARMGGFANDTPSPREQALQRENADLKKSQTKLESEVAEIKSNMVPNGQRFGDLNGTGNAQPTADIALRSTEALNSGEDISDADWSVLQQMFADS